MSELIERQEKRPAVHDEGEFSELMDSARFEHLWRVSKAFSSSDLVPQQFRDKPENCMIVIQMACRAGIDPMAFMQASYVVHGRPGIEAKLAIALLNASGAIKRGTLTYAITGEGKNKQCVASAVNASTGEIIEGPPVSMELADKEGWTKKQGSKWQTMPDLMLRYRSAVFLIRAHYPEVLMGLHTEDELRDVGPVVAQEDSTEKVRKAIAEIDVESEPTEPAPAPSGGKLFDEPGLTRWSEAWIRAEFDKVKLKGPGGKERAKLEYADTLGRLSRLAEEEGADVMPMLSGVADEYEQKVRK